MTDDHRAARLYLELAEAGAGEPAEQLTAGRKLGVLFLALLFLISAPLFWAKSAGGSTVEGPKATATKSVATVSDDDDDDDDDDDGDDDTSTDRARAAGTDGRVDTRWTDRRGDTRGTRYTDRRGDTQTGRTDGRYDSRWTDGRGDTRGTRYTDRGAGTATGRTDGRYDTRGTDGRGDTRGTNTDWGTTRGADTTTR